MEDKANMKLMFLKNHPLLGKKDTRILLSKGLLMPEGWVCVPSWKSRCIFYSYALLDDSTIPLDTKLDTN